MESLLQAGLSGIITGVFSAGAVWGILKTEMRFMRRDIDELRAKCLTRRAGDCNGVA